MNKSYTLWNIPSESWEGIPDNLVVTKELEKKIKETMSEKVSEEELKPFRTQVDQETLAKIIC